MRLFTTNNMNIDIKNAHLRINDKHENSDIDAAYTIEAWFISNNKSEDRCIVLEKFRADERVVAQDVFCRLSFAMDGAPENKIINLAEITKTAKYEYQTGLPYEE